MDDATLIRAREPFFTTKGVGKGTGLGLSMVHGFAAQSGGALFLNSRVGEGTTAEIVLPATEQASSAELPHAQSEAEEESQLKILAVDDDTLVLMNTESMLMELGHGVSTATSGQQALELLRSSSPFDLLITDQAMPGMLGTELCRKVRETAPDMPLIVATGYGELDGLLDGVVVLSKPFDEESLRRAISTSRGQNCDNPPLKIRRPLPDELGRAGEK